ncbi:hypothetical protein J3R82DRAFT_7099 [Butyriboletus roseoflavus]|nr:hypothetical protein J3R82DRAFT_7099 [Butyriboletus roseoflavus]
MGKTSESEGVQFSLPQIVPFVRYSCRLSPVAVVLGLPKQAQGIAKLACGTIHSGTVDLPCLRARTRRPTMFGPYVSMLLGGYKLAKSAFNPFSSLFKSPSAQRRLRHRYSDASGWCIRPRKPHIWRVCSSDFGERSKLHRSTFSSEYCLQCQAGTVNVRWVSGEPVSDCLLYALAYFPLLLAAEYVHDPFASKLSGGLLFMGSLTASSFSYQERGAHLSRVVHEECPWNSPHSGRNDIGDTSCNNTRIRSDDREVVATMSELIVKRNALGVGDLTNINVPADGVASASGEGDHMHGLVFTRAYGQLEQIYDWTSFVSQERFCFRACKPSAAASTTCTRIYDIFGCWENIPGNYDSGVFDALEVPATLYQEVLAAPARPISGYTTCGTIGDAQVDRARRAIASTSGSTSSALVTSYRSHRHSTTLTSSIAPTTTDTATTVTFPSLTTSTLTATAFTNSISSTPVSSATPTSTPHSYSYSHIHTHWHSDIYRHSRHRSSTSSASVSSSSSHHSLTYLRSSSSTAPSLSDPASTSSATPSFTLTFSTYSSLDLSSSGTSTTVPASAAPTSTSSDGTSSSGVSSYQSSSTATPTSSPASPPTSPSTSSQSSDVLTFTTSYSSSSVPTTSTATSQHSQTQLGSQCPPPSQNAGSIVPSPAPLFPLIFAILMIVLSSSVGALVL